MLYNCWRVEITENGTIEKRLDDSDKYERNSVKTHKPVLMGTKAFIFFPRKDEKTNQKYLKKLLTFWRKELDKTIEELSEIRFNISYELEEGMTARKK